MTFVCNRRFWDTANLVEFKIGDRIHPSIFVTQDFSMVFLITVHPRTGMSLRRILPDEAAVLAARFGVEVLQRVFPLPSERRMKSGWQGWLGRLKFITPANRRELAAVGD